MATKDLARTTIEGGRTRWSGWFRHHTNRELRARERAALACSVDPDGEPWPRQTPAHRQFHDKLGPPRRWLERQAGRPWDVVRGELFARFDVRSTPGRHIVFCHMLPWVEDKDGFGFGRRRPFDIDVHGILRARASRRARSFRHRALLPRPQHELEAWLARCRVGERGQTLFWFVLTVHGAYRQERRLDPGDGALWRSLPGWFRQLHAFTTPGSPTRTRD
jgi:hypothetical protein